MDVLRDSPKSLEMTPEVVLVPCQRYRKKRPSYSPLKNYGTPPPRLAHSNPPTLQREEPEASDTYESLNVKYFSLEFKEFTHARPDGGFNVASNEMLDRLLAAVVKLYPMVDTIDARDPYMLVWCHEATPTSDTRPFMIAGLLAIWLTNDDGEPWEFDRGDQGDAWVGLDMGDYATDIQSYRIPKAETLRAIYGYPEFTNALSITFLDDTYIIELPEQAEEDYLKHIKQLPGCFMHHPSPDLRYFNGRRGQLEYSTGTHRLKQPQPATVDGQCDDTDYAAERGCFYPGSIISSIVDGVPSSVSAGILLQKDNERRLTVAIHGWQHELELAKPLEDRKRPADRSSQSEAEAPTEQAPSIEQKAVAKQEGSQESQSQLQAQIRLGDPQHFRIRQGDTGTSTDVGYVTERLSNTDIGLAILDNENVTFRNEFLELPSVPKVLLYSDELVYKSQWAIDSYTTGLQAPFHSQGKKMIRERSRGGHFANNPDIQPGKYIEIIQGIFYTGETRISTPPVIREGVSGSVVVRLHQAEVVSKTERTIASRTTKNPDNKEPKIVIPAKQRDVSSPRPSSEMAGPTEGSPGYPLTNIFSKRDDQVPLYHKGEIGGFMNWADLQKKGHYRKQLFCYADCTDPLIEAGWSVAVTQPSPKRKRNSTEKVNDPFSD